MDAFRHPSYAVVLGRSQDLFTYTSIECIALQQAGEAYFEHTLLPYTMAVQVGHGLTELFPRYLDYERKRTPTFARYLLLEEHVKSNDFWHSETPVHTVYWVDPTAPVVDGLQRGVFFHTFVGGEYEAISLA